MTIEGRVAKGRRGWREDFQGGPCLSGSRSSAFFVNSGFLSCAECLALLCILI